MVKDDIMYLNVYILHSGNIVSYTKVSQVIDSKPGMLFILDYIPGIYYEETFRYRTKIAFQKAILPTI